MYEEMKGVKGAVTYAPAPALLYLLKADAGLLCLADVMHIPQSSCLVVGLQAAKSSSTPVRVCTTL